VKFLREKRGAVQALEKDSQRKKENREGDYFLHSFKKAAEGQAGQENVERKVYKGGGMNTGGGTQVIPKRKPCRELKKGFQRKGKNRGKNRGENAIFRCAKQKGKKRREDTIVHLSVATKKERHTPTRTGEKAKV